MKIKTHNRYVFFELLLPCYIILSCYTMYGHSTLAFLGIIFLIFSFIITGNLRINVQRNKPLVLLFIYIIIHDVLKLLIIDVNSVYFNSLLETTVYLFCYIFISNQLEEEHIYNIWRIIGAIVLVVLIYQAIQVYIYGREVSTVYFLPESFRSYRSGEQRLRPQGIFIEPAQVVEFYVPLFFMSMKRKRLIELTLISFGILVTGSTLGLVFLVFGWLTYFAFIIRVEKKKMILVAVVAIALLLVFLNNSAFFASRSKLTSVIEGKTSQVRLVYGFKIIGDTEWTSLIFGVPYSNISDYLSHETFGEYVTRMYSAYSSQSITGGYSFTSALTYWIVIYGVVGFMIVIFTLFFRFRKIRIEWKLFVIWTVITYIGQWGGVPYLFIPISLIYGLKNDKNEYCEMLLGA